MQSVQDDWLPSESGFSGGGTLRQNLDVPLNGFGTTGVSDLRVGGPGGQLAAVGGKRAILLLDLDHPWQPLLSLKFPGSW